MKNQEHLPYLLPYKRATIFILCAIIFLFSGLNISYADYNTCVCKVMQEPASTPVNFVVTTQPRYSVYFDVNTGLFSTIPAPIINPETVYVPHSANRYKVWINNTGTGAWASTAIQPNFLNTTKESHNALHGLLPTIPADPNILYPSGCSDFYADFFFKIGC